jgi:hypothetical protein
MGGEMVMRPLATEDSKTFYCYEGKTTKKGCSSFNHPFRPVQRTNSIRGIFRVSVLRTDQTPYSAVPSAGLEA